MIFLILQEHVSTPVILSSIPKIVLGEYLVLANSSLTMKLSLSLISSGDDNIILTSFPLLMRYFEKSIMRVMPLMAYPKFNAVKKSIFFLLWPESILCIPLYECPLNWVYIYFDFKFAAMYYLKTFTA